MSLNHQRQWIAVSRCCLAAIALLTLAACQGTGGSMGGKAGMTVKKSSFGTTKDGDAVDAYTLSNRRGMVVKLTNYGATLVAVHVPDRQGKVDDVILGFDDVSGYQGEGNQYFGCTTGRVANRIAKGTFKVGDKEYKVEVNNGPNHLHGGVKRSLDKVLWDAEVIVDHAAPVTQASEEVAKDEEPKAVEFEPVKKDGAAGDADKSAPVEFEPVKEKDEPAPEPTEFIGKGNAVAVRFTYTSPDGEEGYPGKLTIVVTYTLSDDNALTIDYEATTDADTPVNLTNHAYWNLGGAGDDSALDQVLMLNADKYTPTDDTLIPTGKIIPVKFTALDFTKPMVIGDRVEQLIGTPALGYDHNFVLNKPEEGKLTLAAKLSDPKSGRVMEIHTTEPGIQFYSGNYLNGQTGKGGKTYPQRGAVCLETQHFPDSVNQPSFPSTILKPGETYTQKTVHKFSVAP